MKNIKIEILKNYYAIAQISNISIDFFNMLTNGNTFYCFSCDADEKSIICEESILPTSINSNKGWTAIKILGPIDFEATGILLKILKPLANINCSVLVASTFSTDYIFFKSDQLQKVKNVLSQDVTVV